MTKHFVVRYKTVFCGLWPENSGFMFKTGCIDSQTVMELRQNAGWSGFPLGPYWVAKWAV